MESKLFVPELFLERVLQDKEIEAKLIKIYLEKTPQLMQELETALENHDAALVERIAHTLKSSGANLGVNEISELARTIEEASHQKMLSTLPEVFNKLKLITKRLIIELEDIYR